MEHHRRPPPLQLSRTQEKPVLTGSNQDVLIMGQTGVNRRKYQCHYSPKKPLGITLNAVIQPVGLISPFSQVLPSCCFYLCHFVICPLNFNFPYFLWRFFHLTCMSEAYICIYTHRYVSISVHIDFYLSIYISIYLCVCVQKRVGEDLPSFHWLTSQIATMVKAEPLRSWQQELLLSLTHGCRGPNMWNTLQCIRRKLDQKWSGWT